MSHPPVTRFTSAQRVAVRTELEATREAFHTLLSELSDDDWQRQCPDSEWTVRETLAHVVRSMNFFSGQIDRARKGRGIPRVLPSFIVNRINTSMTRRNARNTTPQLLAQQYDTAHAQLLKTLETVQDDEWTKGASFFGQYVTIADIFHSPTRHFNEHAAQVRQAVQVA